MGMVLGVFSAKGGVGKSLLAANLAVAFGSVQGLSTILVDLTPGTGSADLLLDLEPQRGWQDLLEVINELTHQQLKRAVVEFHSKVDLLACPRDFHWQDSLQTDWCSVLLEALRKEYGLVVVDTSPGSGKLSAAALKAVDLSMIMLTPDAPCLTVTARYLMSISARKAPGGLIINQHFRDSLLDPAEIGEFLGWPVWGVLPMDPRGAWRNVSYGEPCVLSRSSSLGRSISRLAARMIKSGSAIPRYD